MDRVKLKFPEQKPLFTSHIAVRISDINYGNHLGNDSVLSLIHEARMQLLAQWGYTELEAGGTSLIMGDVMIAYKGEAFYGEMLTIKLYASEITDRSFDLLYHISTNREGQAIQIAHAKTGMVCFNYSIKRIANLTPELKSRLTGMDI